MKTEISVSILDSDLTAIKETLLMLSRTHISMVHFDVMDGNFVPNITFGAKFIKSARKLSNLIFDTHLMIKNPEKYLHDFIDAGCDIITIHYEASKNIKDIIKKIKDSGKKVGISIKPKTPVNVLKKYLPDLDLILIMSVEPGFGGQKFMESVLKKVEYLKKMKTLNKYKYLIEIDGGINLQTAPLAIKSGVNVLVIGSAIFSSNNPELAIKNFKKLINKKW